MRDRDDYRPAADPTKLGERGVRVVEVLEHFKAKDDVEAAVLERQRIDAFARNLDRGKPARGEIDRLLAHVHSGHA